MYKIVGNITAFLTAEADRIMRNGETYLDITKLNIDPVIGSLKLDAPTFFNGNRELCKFINILETFVSKNFEF